ncbi:MAG TPA: TetR/AcrR family transcriptional regulator [Thermomicrobiales bacterium]|nr:TetR/AcrR family transcriptional regulator [Thermomicrobiales bacterium]
MITEEFSTTSSGESAPPPTSRQRIVDIARRLFIDEGYLGVSMQQIADIAGLRKASLYHHFRSKESLFADVMAELMDRILRDFAAVDLDDAPLEEQLRQIALINYRQFDQPEIHRLAMDFFKHVPESEHTEVHERLRSMQAVFSDIFERAIERGEMRAINPHYAATMFFHMMMALAHQEPEFAAVPPPPADEAAALVIDVLLHGLAGKPTQR